MPRRRGQQRLAFGRSCWTLCALTRPGQALSATLVLSYLCCRLSTSLGDVVALIPDKVVPRVWTLATSGFYEWNALSLALNLLALYHVGQRLERVWGAKAR